MKGCVESEPFFSYLKYLSPAHLFPLLSYLQTHYSNFSTNTLHRSLDLESLLSSAFSSAAASAAVAVAVAAAASLSSLPPSTTVRYHRTEALVLNCCYYQYFHQQQHPCYHCCLHPPPSEHCSITAPKPWSSSSSLHWTSIFQLVRSWHFQARPQHLSSHLDISPCTIKIANLVPVLTPILISPIHPAIPKQLPFPRENEFPESR